MGWAIGGLTLIIMGWGMYLSNKINAVALYSTNGDVGSQSAILFIKSGFISWGIITIGLIMVVIFLWTAKEK